MAMGIGNTIHSQTLSYLKVHRQPWTYTAAHHNEIKTVPKWPIGWQGILVSLSTISILQLV